MSQDRPSPPPEETEHVMGEPLRPSAEARQAFQRIYERRERVTRDLERQGPLFRQAWQLAESLWNLAQKPRAEDRADDGIVIVEGVTLRLLAGETPPERICRALGHIFGVVFAVGELDYTVRQIGRPQQLAKELEVEVKEPFDCRLEVERRATTYQLSRTHSQSPRTIEAFLLLAYDDAAARAFIRRQAQQCRDQSLRQFLLNFRTKESLLLAVAAMLDGEGSTFSRLVGQPATPVRQLRGIRIRRHEHSGNSEVPRDPAGDL